jgi:hypothetical protein
VLGAKKSALSLRSPYGVYLASTSVCITKHILETLRIRDRQLQTPLVPTQSHLETDRHLNRMVRNMRFLIPAHGNSGFPIINPP